MPFEMPTCNYGTISVKEIEYLQCGPIYESELQCNKTILQSNFYCTKCIYCKPSANIAIIICMLYRCKLYSATCIVRLE